MKSRDGSRACWKGRPISSLERSISRSSEREISVPKKSKSGTSAPKISIIPLSIPGQEISSATGLSWHMGLSESLKSNLPFTWSLLFDPLGVNFRGDDEMRICLQGLSITVLEEITWQFVGMIPGVSLEKESQRVELSDGEIDWSTWERRGRGGVLGQGEMVFGSGGLLNKFLATHDPWTEFPFWGLLGEDDWIWEISRTTSLVLLLFASSEGILVAVRNEEITIKIWS